jgi:hypothetical protein
VHLLNESESREAALHAAHADRAEVERMTLHRSGRHWRRGSDQDER